MTSKRRLHVWEHPSLHPAEARKNAGFPVHIIFEDEEYDYWDISQSDGALLIGLIFKVESQSTPGYLASHPYRKEVRYRVSAGMFAKVWEEFYDDAPEDDVPLYNAEEDPDFVGRERFANQRLAPHVPLEPLVPVDLGLDEDDEEKTDDRTVTLAPIQNKVDPDTGVDLTHLARQVNPILFPPPLPPPAIEPPLDETRLDIRSPLMMMTLVGQEKVASAEPLPERSDKEPETPPAAGSQKNSE